MTKEQINELIEKSKPFIGLSINVKLDEKGEAVPFTFSKIGNVVGISENGGHTPYSVSGILTKDNYSDVVLPLYQIHKYFESNNI